MSKKSGPTHVVVDGSNIATEGRSLPSLAQLSDAVASFMEEHPDAAVTVVVDATFGHRIDKKEVKEFEEGISNNELVAPPAGAVGRGDAFVLNIADKANATILSNDSFQEFHADYEWLFDDGRLIGGKPVPHVGWVFVDRVPVRGPVSRKATRGASRSASKSKSGAKSEASKSGSRRASKAASEPMPVPSAPPPGATASAEPATEPKQRRGAPKAQDTVNELLPFLEFVEHHPVGTSVNGTVDAYSSHGAYITIGDEGLRGYIPLRLMSDPPPRSARKVLALGESVTVVVASFAPARRSIDCALPDMAGAVDEGPAPALAPAEVTADEAPAAKKPARKRAASKKAVAATADAGAPTEDTTAATTADVSAAEEPKTTTTAKRTAAKKAPAKKAAARKRAAKKAPAKRSAAKKAPAKKTAAQETAGRDTAAETTVAQKAPAKKTSAKKAPAKKSATRKAPAKKAAATKSSAKTPATRKTAAKKSAADGAGSAGKG